MICQVSVAARPAYTITVQYAGDAWLECGEEATDDAGDDTCEEVADFSSRVFCRRMCGSARPCLSRCVSGRPSGKYISVFFALRKHTQTKHKEKDAVSCGRGVFYHRPYL